MLLPSLVLVLVLLRGSTHSWFKATEIAFTTFRLVRVQHLPGKMAAARGTVMEVLLEAGLATPLPLPVRATVRVVVGKASPKEHLRVGIAPSKVIG